MEIWGRSRGSLVEPLAISTNVSKRAVSDEKLKTESLRYMQCFENCIPLSFEHEKSKNNMNLTKVHSWLTEIDCFFFSGH